MLAIDTFVITVYVWVDEVCKSAAAVRRRGPAPVLTRSEVVTLALLSQWGCFASQRAFYRWAHTHLRWAFPRLPHRSQFNRQMRAEHDTINAMALWVANQLDAASSPYEVVDGSAVPTRSAKRRGRGWLPGVADVGWSNRLGWYEGCKLFLASTPTGVITGFGFGAASTHERALAETFFACRQQPEPGLPTVGWPATGPYLADKGLYGKDAHHRWKHAYQAYVIAPPKRTSRTPWPKALRKWVAGLRQVVESVYRHLHHTFGLQHERPHHLTGLQARLAAKIALHNLCIRINLNLGRPPMAFAELVKW